MQIRTITPDDAEDYRAIRLQALKDNPEAFGGSYEESVERTVADMRTRLETHTADNFILVAVIDEKMVGTVGLVRQSFLKMRHKAIIWGMYVAPETRGSGIGRALMNDVIIRARQLPDLEQLSLTVVTDNTAARQLYLSFGFEIYGLERHALKLGERYLDEEYMVLFLG